MAKNVRVQIDQVGLRYRVRLVQDVPKTTSAYSCNPEDFFETRMIDKRIVPGLFADKPTAEARGQRELDDYNNQFKSFTIRQ